MTTAQTTFGRIDLADYRRATGQRTKTSRWRCWFLLAPVFCVGWMVPSPFLKLSKHWSFERAVDASRSQDDDERRLAMRQLFRFMERGQEPLCKESGRTDTHGKHATLYLEHLVTKVVQRFLELERAENSLSVPGQALDRIRSILKE